MTKQTRLALPPYLARQRAAAPLISQSMVEGICLPSRAGRKSVPQARHADILVETIAAEEPLFLSNPKILQESQIFGESGSAVASPNTSKPCVATKSLLACMGVGIYDPQHHVAGGLHAFFPEYLSHESARVTLMKLLFSYMLADADRLGGRMYKLATFNIAKGDRHPEMTEEIIGVISGLVYSAEYDGRISEIEHRNDRNFIIDSRDGHIYTGQWPTQRK